MKDAIRQTVYWRGGVGHSKVPDSGSPGVAIGEADAPAANPPWHGGHGLSEPRCFFDELNAEFGPVDHAAEIQKAIALLTELGERCDPYRVLLGLDEPPQMGVAA